MSARQELRGDISKRWQHQSCGIKILETVIRLGRAWAKNGSSSDNPSVYKYGQADGSSSYPHDLSRDVKTDDPPTCSYLYTVGLSDELPFFAQTRPRRMIRLQYKSDQCVLYDARSESAECRHLNTYIHFTVLNTRAY